MTTTIDSRTMNADPNQSPLFTFFEHRLQCTEADRHGDDAWPVTLAQQCKHHRLAFEREPQYADHQRAGWTNKTPREYRREASSKDDIQLAEMTRRARRAAVHYGS
jgi:hypothetical protein